MTQGFGERLRDAIIDRGPLCVGIDPHPRLLDAWGLPATAAGAETFGMEVVEAAKNQVAVVKPQVAFFERYGSAGYAALERVIAAARASGLMVIADGKRGDLGTSAASYGEAWLSPGAPLESDALTVGAFQGFGSLDAVVRLAESAGKGLFVLCATSNPEAAAIQLRTDERGVSVASHIERDVVEWNRSVGHTVGSVGLVVGATVRASDYGVTMATPLPILAPGFGFQGAQLADLRSLYPTDAIVLASVSRSVTERRDGVSDAIAAARSEVA